MAFRDEKLIPLEYCDSTDSRSIQLSPLALDPSVPFPSSDVMIDVTSSPSEAYDEIKSQPMSCSSRPTMLDSQIRRISAAQSDFQEAMAAGHRHGRNYILLTLFFLTCLVVSSYFCDKEPGGFDRNVNLKVFLFFLAWMTGVCTFVTGCMRVFVLFLMV